ncbi:dihydroxy-acid dehydratase ilv3 [Cystobasidiomycetes sp. EMM_F5]
MAAPRPSSSSSCLGCSPAERSVCQFSTGRYSGNGSVLNKYSRNITKPKDQGASQAMLYATEGIDKDSDLDKPMIGVASVWYEGNPCNAHLLGMGQRITRSIRKAGLTGYQFGTPAVSDGISMGGDLRCSSLTSG